MFVREENRTVATPGHQLEVDTNTGLLYRNGGAFVDNSYLVLQINKNLSSSKIDLSENTFGKFLDELDKEDVKRAAELQPLLTEVERLGFARVQTRQFDDARNLLTEWRNARQEGDPGKAKRAAFKLFGLLQEAIRVHKATPEKADLSGEQIAYLLDRLARMAMPPRRRSLRNSPSTASRPRPPTSTRCSRRSTATSSA